MKIITNNNFREIINFYELTQKQQDEIKDNYDGVDESSFFIYKGDVYDLSDFMRLDKNSPFDPKWHGYHSTCYFHTILIELSNCGDMVKIGNIYC